MASDSAQNRLRQAITSPTFACTPRKSLVPAASVALSKSPAMKSSLTASRVQPCTTKRGRKPVRGKKLLAFSTSP